MNLTHKPVTHLVFLCLVLVASAKKSRQGPNSAGSLQKLKQAGKDVDNVLNIISTAKTDRRKADRVKASRGELKNKAEQIGDKIVEEELDMLSEDVQKLQKKISHVVDENADEELQNFINSLQADTASLYRDTEELISDAYYDQKIRTYTDVTFDKDLELLRKETRHVLDEVRNIKPDKISTKRKQTRKRTEKKEKPKNHPKDVTDKNKKQTPKDNYMIADLPGRTPKKQNPHSDDVLYSKTYRDSVLEPAALTYARTRENTLDVSWLSRYLQACPQCTVSAQDKSQCPLTSKVLEMKRWANEVQEILTHGCVKPGCDYPGTCCIAADVAIEQTIDQVKNMLKELYDMFHKTCTKCSDGQGDPETSWNEWSPCDVTCGRGMRTRTRSCKPGRECKGLLRETQPCAGASDCCVDGSWSNWESWAPCSATCGRGQTFRRRNCNRPTPNYCGKSCPGPRDETRVCEADKECCTDGNWGRWSSWSACSSSCGGSRRSRTRTCSNPPPSSCGRSCPGELQETEPCNNPVETANGNWGPWQSWSACSSSCGRGYRNRRRACDSPPPGPCGRPCDGRDSEIAACDSERSCCVNGNWGPWQAWSACSATCDIGSRRRRRSCDNPSANYCGEPCRGEDLEMAACGSGMPCQRCVDGNWGNWEPWNQCSVTCGQGSRDRKRSCDNPAPNQCGQRCQGRGFEVGLCDTGQLCEVCVDGQWSPWQPWTPCSVTCGQGVHDRQRSCDRPPPNYCGKKCPGPDQEQRMCDTRTQCVICINGNWGSWQPWTQCSVTCGQGVIERRRQCDSPPANNCGQWCPGRENEMRSCESGVPCEVCVNGNWGQWQAWSPCSVTCGRGTNERRRQCDNPPANRCGQRCPGRENELGSCDTGVPCKVCINGNWGQWQAWSPCSGQGIMERRRLCDNPSPNDCGQWCPGQESELKDCNGMGSLGDETPWSGWSSCDVTCGRAIRSRNRSCKPGRKCKGPMRDTELCTGVPECCVNGNWGFWQAWSPCSVTCGQGVRERRRSCDNPRANYCGQDCVGLERDTETCDSGVPCQICVNGNWGAWQAWSPCSVTCGSGTRDRRRSCDNPSANDCGQPCPGQNSQTDSCEADRPCVFCVDGNWGPWQAWSGCSMTCGRGSIERRRSCDSPPANECGKSCPGREFETDVCNTGNECVGCVDGNWGAWQSWADCTVTCGRGTRERRRSCDNPPFNYCGMRCPGQEFETDVCDTSSVCEVCVDGGWSLWQAWSPCSVTCGRGIRDRRRSCNNPLPNNCGRVCPGQSLETDSCDSGAVCKVCVNGQWSPWTSWTPCSVSCGIGSILRSRNCNNPPPNECGQPCTGPTDERVACRGTGVCECAQKEWSPWGPWSACSATCGFAVRRRSRSCRVVVAGSDCEDDCPGDSLEEEHCEDVTACAGQLGQWSEWSQCSMTCRGRGLRGRFITTSRLVGRGDQTVATNETRREIERCEVIEPECPSWGQWSVCSATCRGQGFRERVISISATPIGTGDVPVESNATRKEVEACQVTGPECPSWGQWSACSATCQGRGVRERTISTSARNIGTGDVPVESDATRKEVEDCVVNEPECPYGDAMWAEWDSWCPCDCKQGIRTRRRDCEKASLLGDNPQKVPIAQCQGEARDVEDCNPRLQCPACISNCNEVSPGLYPSCRSCSHYMSCQENQDGVDLMCTPANTEWDAFVKSCVPSPSPSCTLHECLLNCTDKVDGTYHSCNGCNTYIECTAGQITERSCQDPRMEWNQHKKKCEIERSPTCPREQLWSIRSSIIGGGFTRRPRY